MASAEKHSAAWRADAYTLPSLTFNEFRNELIYETQEIEDFLHDTRGEAFIISAPKGFGKTLLLIAKRTQLEVAASSHLAPSAMMNTVSSGGEIVDRPSNSLSQFTLDQLHEFSTNFSLWKKIWSVAIRLSAIKLDYRSNQKPGLMEDKEFHPWVRKQLEYGPQLSPCDLFTKLLNLNFSMLRQIVGDASALDPYFKAIRSQILFYIDNVDQCFEDLFGGDSSDGAIRSPEYVKNCNNVWTLAQLGLISAAYSLHSVNRHVKVYCTVRREAFIRLVDYTAEAGQISGRTIQLLYSRSDLEAIFEKNVRLMNKERLYRQSKSAPDAMAMFFGPSYRSYKHPLLEQPEPAFQYMLRHTFLRPRDLMQMGRAIGSIPVTDRTPEAVMEKISEVGEGLVRQLSSEMRPFFHLPDLNLLLRYVDSNVLTRNQLEQASMRYQEDTEVKEAYGSSHDHPFCVLYRIGLLGYIRANQPTGKRAMQRFVKPDEIVIKNDVGLPATDEFYLIHPSLDQIAMLRRGNIYMRRYDRYNPIGHGLSWTEPGSSLFVVKGDIRHFSEIMPTEFYEPITERLHEWVRSICYNLKHAAVSEGDSVIMVDGNPDLLIDCASALQKRASTFQGKPFLFRFGGSVGPIVLPDAGRRRGEENTMPQGLTGMALRTSARLEPHAPAGCLLLDEEFIHLGNLPSSRQVTEAQAHVLPKLTYVEERGTFLVQKNPSEMALETKLYVVDLR